MFHDATKPIFRAFDSHAAVTIYRRAMPHWRQEGATYFVTFRLGDSVPAQVVAQWQEEDRVWLAANGISGPLSDPGNSKVYAALPEKQRRSFERRAAHRLHVELDQCQGACLLKRVDVREIVSGAILHFHGTRWWVGDFVLMPNHVHALLRPMCGYALETILGSVKSFVSTRLTHERFKSGALWQQDNYDHIVRNRKELEALRRYIQENPTVAKLGTDRFTYHPRNGSCR